jgi:hypothetical protein
LCEDLFFNTRVSCFGSCIFNHKDQPPAGSFFLDKKGTKKSRPIEIYLSSLRNSGKIPFFCGISPPALCRQISKWPFKKIKIFRCDHCLPAGAAYYYII